MRVYTASLATLLCACAAYAQVDEVRVPFVELEGGEGASIEQVDGEAAVITGQRKSTWAGTLTLPAGRWIVSIEAWATNNGNDSIIFSFDGAEEETRWFDGSRSHGLKVLNAETAREVPFVLKQREGPGTTLVAVVAKRFGSDVPRVPVQIRPELAGEHPRIILSEASIPAIRDRLNSEAQRDLWLPLLESTRRRAAQSPPEDPPNTEDPFRGFGDRLAAFAFVYTMEPDTELLANTKRWIEAVCTYPSWAGDRDLGAGHICFGLALAYDWLYDELSPAERTMIEERLTTQARILFEVSVTGAYWANSYWQNHCWINHCGLSTAGMALLDVIPDEAQTWIDYARSKFDVTMRVFGPDGANHEGPAYSVYGTQWILHYLETLRSFSGESLYDSDYLRGYATYRLHVGMPDWRNVVNYGDCPPTEWGPPDSILIRLAAEYQDGIAQWLAAEMAAAREYDGYDTWQSALWHDAALEATHPAAQPTWHHFADLDLASMRTHWGPDASVAALKCGPPLGHSGIEHMRTMEEASMGAGHDNPDANAIYFWADGGWRIGDPASYTHDKETAHENTVKIGGHDQLGRAEWFYGESYLGLQEQPRIIRVQSTDVAALAEGEAGSAYPEEAGVESFRRIALLLKTGSPVLIVLDRITLREPAQIEWFYHAFAPFAVEEGTFRTAGDFPVFGRIEVLGEAQPTLVAEQVMAVSHNRELRAEGTLEHKGEQVRATLSPQDNVVRAVTVLSLAESGLSLEEVDHALRIEAADASIVWGDDGTVELDRGDAFARFEPIR